MSDPIVLRKSNHIRRDGWAFGNDWVEVSNIQLVSSGGPGNYLYKVDGIEYHSRSQKWKTKLNELQTWSKLQNV